MGSKAGAMKTAATRLGISVEDYAARTDAGQKWCRSCREWHAREDFNADRSRGDGLAAQCRASFRRTAPGPTKPERRVARAQGEAWCSKCEDWLSASDVRGGLCRTHRNEAWREQYRANPAPYRGRAAARRRGVAHVGPETRAALFEATGGLCAYSCGRPAEHLDHVIPVAMGGKTVYGNMVPACPSCNSSKKDSDPLPWIDRMTLDAWDLIAHALAVDSPVMDLLEQTAA
ncbi:HNH endonuclease [Mycolicibacterium fortuitum]|uniref:HNH endonuclease n=1 Tax=Mycolicibacterium fortuitum TaxID=1766 RepID=UPI00148F5274|nr:HNH endonuclease [Mycolicibacterium fortuitum]